MQRVGKEGEKAKIRVFVDGEISGQLLDVNKVVGKSSRPLEHRCEKPSLLNS